jgi:hypothetical protein
MKKINLSILLVFILMLEMLSCKPDSELIPQTQVKLRLTHRVGEKNLVLKNQKYLNATGDTFSVNQFDYYLSNLKLISKKGTFSVANSYHLIRVGSQSPIVELTLNNVPEDEYTALEFGLGVDSVANSSTKVVGDLDPNNAMAWNWLTGYKFVRFEGFHFKENAQRAGLVFHIGTNPNYRTIRLENKVLTDQTFDIEVDVLKMFSKPNPIDFDQINEAMFGDEANLIAENYVNMFR